MSGECDAWEHDALRAENAAMAEKLAESKTWRLSEISYFEARVKSLEAEVAREHELYLTAHRDNLKAATRIMELKAEISRKDAALRYVHDRVEGCETWSKDGNCIISEALSPALSKPEAP